MKEEKQWIICIGREFGSGGHEIGEKLAAALGFGFYDRKMLDEIAAGMNINVEVLEAYDEKVKNVFLSRRVRGFSNSMEEILSNIQFDYIREKAESGESFVIVGRCAEQVLKNHPHVISIFITGDFSCKLKRVMEKYQLTESEARSKMERHDRTRKQYHNRHCEKKWGDSRNYDMCINSSGLGVDLTVKLLEQYVKGYMKTQDS